MGFESGVIGDQAVHLRQTMADVLNDLELFIDDHMPVSLIGDKSEMGQGRVSGKDKAFGNLGRGLEVLD